MGADIEHSHSRAQEPLDKSALSVLKPIVEQCPTEKVVSGQPPPAER
jgi:hypothetical protein